MVATHCTWSVVAPKSRCMVGTATLTMSVSRIDMNMPTTSTVRGSPHLAGFSSPSTCARGPRLTAHDPPFRSRSPSHAAARSAGRAKSIPAPYHRRVRPNLDEPDGRGQLAYGSPQGRWVLAVTILGSAVASLDATVVNVALPSIGRDLHAGFSGLQWTVNGYTLALGSLLLLGGSLGDRYGRRRLLVIGLLVFTAASLLCGLAPSTGLLVAARVAQGAGGAMLTPESLAIITATFRHEDRGRPSRAWAGTQGLASAVGPLVGGWLVAAVSWRLIFLIHLPLAALTIL